jgi:hypothetical protein
MRPQAKNVSVKLKMLSVEVVFAVAIVNIKKERNALLFCG